MKIACWILLLSTAVWGNPEASHSLVGEVARVYSTSEPAVIGALHHYLLEVHSPSGVVYVHVERLEKRLPGQRSLSGPEVPPVSARLLRLEVEKDSQGRWRLRAWRPAR